ncbi:hypothetical protein GCM10020000_10860 [Streptomyces olivoverticillatus]
MPLGERSVDDVLGEGAVERLDDAVPEVLLGPAALRQTLLDGGDPAVPLLGVVVAGVNDRDALGGLVEQPGRQVRDGLERNGDHHDLGAARRLRHGDGGGAGLLGQLRQGVRATGVGDGDVVPESGQPPGEVAADVAERR